MSLAAFGCDPAATCECSIFVHRQTRGGDVAAQGATSGKGALLRSGNVSLDRAVYRNGSDINVTGDARVFAYGECAGGSHIAFDLTIDQEFGAECHVADYRDSSGENSSCVCTSWHVGRAFHSGGR